MDDRSGLTGNPVLRRRVGRRGNAKVVRAGEEHLKDPSRLSHGGHRLLCIITLPAISGTSRYAEAGGARCRIEITCPKLRTLCNLRIGLLLLSFPFAKYRKMQRS